jgi:uncharacterized protein
MIERHLSRLIDEALTDTRIVMLGGARQVGKSTLIREIARQRGVEVFTLDDQLTRELATTDPQGFLAGITDRPLVLDEVQRAPDLLLALKLLVDQDTRPGRALLTGSANVLTFPGIADALTGRMDLETLWAFSQAEIEGVNTNLIDLLFDGRPPSIRDAPIGLAAWAARALAGGYPEAREKVGRSRSRWFSNYLRTSLTRDLRDLDDVRRIDMVPRLVALLADRATGVVVWAKVASEIGLAVVTVRSYVRLLESIYVITVLPAWRPGVGKRELAAPKVLMSDTGLLSHLLRADIRRVAEDSGVAGKLFEHFVATELVKHLATAETDARLYHYRDTARRGGTEIDLVIEDLSGDVVAVEMKAAASLARSDWSALEWLRDQRSDRFRLGVVVYAGERTQQIGDRLWALPVSSLWTASSG